MALEDALLKLAEAINNHAEAIKQTTGKAPVVAKADASAKKETTKPADTTKTNTTSATATAETTDTPAVTPDTTAEPTGDAPPDVDVADMKAKFLELVNTNRAAAEKVLATVGFPKLNLVPANLHAKVYGLIADALAATEDLS